MPDKYYGINTGSAKDTVTEGATTTSKDVEVTLTVSTVPSKQDLVNSVLKLLDHIIQSPSPV
jgi:hypothetical protein